MIEHVWPGWQVVRACGVVAAAAVGRGTVAGTSSGGLLPPAGRSSWLTGPVVDAVAPAGRSGSGSHYSRAHPE